jgi:hypothetical protein
MTVSINFRPEASEEIDATFQWYEEQRRPAEPSPGTDRKRGTGQELLLRLQV